MCMWSPQACLLPKSSNLPGDYLSLPALGCVLSNQALAQPSGTHCALRSYLTLEVESWTSYSPTQLLLSLSSRAPWDTSFFSSQALTGKAVLQILDFFF